MPAVLITIYDPKKPPNAAEQAVAEALLKLGDGFVIRWGFYYANEDGSVQGEGDFLVLGPDGNVLHLEVKGGRCEWDPRTHRWDTADGNNPIDQREKIWAQVLGMLKRQATVRRSGPLVHRMLALPDVTCPHTVLVYQNLPREGFLDAVDLAGIGKWWKQHFKQVWRDVGDRRAVFLEVFAATLPAEVSRQVLTLTEQAIERHTVARFELLDALAQNRQFLFRGGPGTGKTWFALEQAFRWAREDKRVLFLCFNLHLADMLKDFVAAKKVAGIEVISYEALAVWLYEQVGEKFPQVDQTDRAAAKRFYEVEMPANLRVIVGMLSADQRFDALVVDEAQDHDTRFHAEVKAPAEAPGWWELYAGLLREGGNAPVALFYDKFQRHHGRKPEDFDPAKLIGLFPGLVRVRLKRTMRYTRQILDFLRGIKHPEIVDLLADMGRESSLPDGPEPLVIEAKNLKAEKQAVDGLIKAWCKKGECRPEDVLILFPTSACRPEWLKKEKLNAIAIAPDGRTGGIRWSSVHKAKGLEAQAVILVGFPPRSEVLKESAPPGLPFTWFMGVSRARLLLAIIEGAYLSAANVKTM